MPHRKRATDRPQWVRNTFVPGDAVEFWSADHGGCWKRGVVVPVIGAYLPEYTGHVYTSTMVRIHVGDGVCVIRPVCKCRRVVE